MSQLVELAPAKRRFVAGFTTACAVSLLVHGAIMAAAHPVAAMSPLRAASQIITARQISLPTFYEDTAGRGQFGRQIPANPKVPTESAGNVTAKVTPPRVSGLVADFVETEYIPAAELPIRPAPVSEVLLPYPDEPDITQVVKIRLTLFINEQGIVDKVVLDDDESPRRFADIARKTFERTVFSPGVREGQAVKTRTRIEVSFTRSAGLDSSPGL